MGLCKSDPSLGSSLVLPPRSGPDGHRSNLQFHEAGPEHCAHGSDKDFPEVLKDISIQKVI